jgi:tripartite-type tricarboxylate transporter receptor subunit TctC
MVKKLSLMALFILGLALIHDAAVAAGPFYESKTIRLIVGHAPGGGFDIWARIIARYAGKHIPGNPAIIVENMVGAGGMICANYTYRMAKPDGLSIGSFDGNIFFNQLFGRPGVEFDARRFEYLDYPMKTYQVFVFTKASGITNMEKLMASDTPVKMGGQAGGSTPDNFTRVIKAALGLPIKLVMGYKGSSDVRLAMASGEVAGHSFGWDSLNLCCRRLLETGEYVVVLQAVPKALPGLPNVPLAIDLAKTDEARRLIKVGIHNTSTIIRATVVPPDTPKDRVQILRNAFQETFKDKEFLAAAEKEQLCC